MSPPYLIFFCCIGTTRLEHSKNMQVACRPPYNLQKFEKGSEKVQKSDKTKTLTNADIEKMLKRFSDLDSDIGRLGLGLIEELKFARKTLKKLKTNINKNGVVVEMDQGKYKIDRTNPALTTYNTLIKNYQSLSSQIYTMLSNLDPSEDDDFDSDDL